MIISRRAAIMNISTLFGGAFLGGCAMNPVTGKRELMLMTEGQEIALGNQSHAEITASYGIYADSGLQSWFGAKGEAMARVNERSTLDFTFTVLDSPVVNAFAVPGGHVYVTRGILSYFNDEAQFAGVLGHEMGHVAARHSAQQYSKTLLISAAIAAGSLFSDEFARYAPLASAGAMLMFLKFSRDDERQADQLGVRYASELGYDAACMSEFFATLERLSPSSGALPEWTSTHPNPGNRVTATRKQAREYQRIHPGVRFVSRRTEYLERINGLVYGDDPRQGYQKGGSFHHPGMKFSFPAPAGWTLTNQVNEVRMTPKGTQNSALIFRTVSAATPQDAGAAFAAANEVTVTGASAVTVNGMKGYSSTGKIVSGETTTVVSSCFIAFNDTIVSFHGIAPSASWSGIEPQFRASALGFRRLTDKSLLAVSPKRVEVRAVSRTKTLGSAFQDMGVPKDTTEKLAIMNGLKLGDSLAAGTRVKMVL